ncbi:MAG: hypothetical protein HY723_01495 [Chloroflexi bacterium]|nr:hypothetical protein [Chloroflexota bacterium]
MPLPLRILAATALVGASFAAQRFVYHGWCVIPTDGEFFRFFVLPALFFVGAVWLAGELVGVVLAGARVPRVAAAPVALVAGISLYVAVAGAVWFVNPVPADNADNIAIRALMSFFWSAGILQETGNFNSFSCGY